MKFKKSTIFILILGGYILSIFVLFSVLGFQPFSNKEQTVTRIQTVEINNHNYGYCPNCRKPTKLTGNSPFTVSTNYVDEQNNALQPIYFCSECNFPLYFESYYE